MKHAKHMLLMAAMLLGCFSVSAEVVQIDGIWYDVVKKAKQAKVVSNPDGATEYSGNITIPSTIEYEGVECSVTSIGDEAFYYCRSLTSISLPESVTSIGNGAFRGCGSLTTITIPEGVTIIEAGAFDNCSRLTAVHISSLEAWYNIDFVFYHSNPLCYAHNLYLNGELVTELVIPEGVTSIGGSAFYNCRSLTTITIPESVTSIGYEAFCGCSNLTSITIPENSQLTSIGDGAFRGCSSLTSINIPEGVTSIGGSAFYDCTDLISITIPEGVTSIGDYAFYNCNSLTSITIPESVTSIGDYAFYNCNNLTSITIPEGVTSIESFVFSNCSNLTTINIPEGVTSIGFKAFYYCSSLTSINIPEGVTGIGEWTFSECDDLLDVYCYAERVPSMWESAFENSYPEYITLHVPTKSLNDYKATAPWSSFGKFETIETIVSSITLSGTSLTLTVGDVWQLSVTKILPENATDKSVVWSSSNLNVATVDEGGRVQAIAPGSATITATANDGSGVCASCGVTVNANPQNVIFMVDGQVYDADIAEDGTFPEAPEKEGYTFVEWFREKSEIFQEVDIANNADEMLYTNAPCTNTKWGDQFTSWDVLFDGDASTIFHSEYSEGVNSEDGLDHYLRVDMGEDNAVEKFSFTYTVRETIPIGGNYSPSKMVVEGANMPDGPYTELASLAYLPRTGGEVYESRVIGNGKAYRYIRFRVTETYMNVTVQGHPYFFMGEFGMKVSKEVQDVAQDVVYHAVYTLNTYKVYYYVGEELVNTINVPYGQPMPEYTYEPTDNNEEFLGWEGDTYSTMPAHDVTYRAIINSDETGDSDDSDARYSLTFMVDGEVFQTETSETPIEVVFPEAPEKEGHSFVRWELSSSDATLTDIDIANNADEMLYTNAPCTNTKYGDQFTSWDVLFDGDYTTFFHSEYSEGVDSEDGEHHYLRVDMGEGNSVKQFTFSYAMRGDQFPNHTPTEIIVEGSNEAFGEYEIIAVLTDLAAPPYDIDYNSEILGDGSAYRYIRYRVTKTRMNSLICGHPYFYISEFGMKKAQDCYNAVYHGVYAPNKYKVYYYVGEELLDYVEVTYGDQMPDMGYFPALETEEFLGWVSETGDTYETMPAHDVVYVANIRTYEKCATPTIHYADGRVTFSCETEGVEFRTRVTDGNRRLGGYRTDSDGFEFVPTYIFTTYATKEDCIDSDEVSITVCWIDCTGEHEEEEDDDETDVISVPSQPVIIQCANGVIILTGLAEGTAVAVYDTAGMEQGTAEAVNGTVTIATNPTAGSTAIVKMGNRSVKIAIK